MIPKWAIILERVILRGIEGQIQDRYLEQVVKAEWRNANEADEALHNQFEARSMAEAVYCHWKGLDK